MNIFNSEKLKKGVAILLASLSVTFFGGCQKNEKKGTEQPLLTGSEEPTKVDQEEQYKKALEKAGAEVSNPSKVTEKAEASTQPKTAEKAQASTQPKETEKNELIREIVGETSRDKLEKVLEEKTWSSEVEKMVLELYDLTDRNYNYRDMYKPTEKQQYLSKLVQNIKNIDSITINPNDAELVTNNWDAKAQRSTNSIVLKSAKELDDARHEIAHLEEGNFLNGSMGVDLGFILEEGRASFLSGDAKTDVNKVDGRSKSIIENDNGKIEINDYSGSYPVFEDIYKSFLKMGIDMETIRKERPSVNETKEILSVQINKLYGNELGTKYLENVCEYIQFFDSNGKIERSKNERGTSIFEFKNNMNEICNMCKMQEKTVNDRGMDR